ncbi:MAG: signal peptide peptidase SppA [Candidatus Rokubacteria bacterium]|nr:signal peptide peptidase SppA [Candidatus Rokubacteria bacterium]
MGRRAFVLTATLAIYVVSVAVGLAALGAMVSSGGQGLPFGSPRVAIVEIEGLIVDAQDAIQDLRSHRDNPRVRAVVVRINSPGGVVGPTQELHEAIRRLREAGKPVVASLGAVAASGGYYVAVAADQIYANPGTLTGSIGVIMQMANLENLFKKVGVDYVVVKAGRFKDIGNVSRPMTPEERRVLQTLLDDVHTQFIEAVANGRKLDRTRVVEFADGRIFSGAQAKALRMVDALGGLEDAVNRAATLAGLRVPPSVIPPRRRLSILDLLWSRTGLPAAFTLGPNLPVFKTPLYLMD